MEEKIKSLILDVVSNVEWEKVVFSTTISKSGSSRPTMFLVDRTGLKQGFRPSDIMKLIEIDDLVKTDFNKFINDSVNRFNKVEFEVSKDGTHTANYFWDEEEAKNQKFKTAEVFPIWLHERYLQFLFEAGYGDNTHWQKGVFTTSVKNNSEVEIRVTLFNDEQEILADPNFPEYVYEAILKHYEITNNGDLSDVWKKWNTLKIETRRTSVDLDKDVEYSLED